VAQVWPATVSAMSHDWTTPQARVFFGMIVAMAITLGKPKPCLRGVVLTPPPSPCVPSREIDKGYQSSASLFTPPSSH
jgi:hypothetical protein